MLTDVHYYGIGQTHQITDKILIHVHKSNDHSISEYNTTRRVPCTASGTYRVHYVINHNQLHILTFF
jgi:hypothetical protein